jgi:hypothetical protein
MYFTYFGQQALGSRQVRPMRQTHPGLSLYPCPGHFESAPQYNTASVPIKAWDEIANSHPLGEATLLILLEPPMYYRPPTLSRRVPFNQRLRALFDGCQMLKVLRTWKPIVSSARPTSRRAEHSIPRLDPLKTAIQHTGRVMGRD